MKRLMLKEYFKIFNYIKPNKVTYFFILIADCLTEISFYLLTPVVMKLMIDAAVNSDAQLLKDGLMLTILVSAAGMVLFVSLEFFLFKSFNVTTASISKKVFEHILHLPISYVEQNHSADTISRLTNDIGIMQNAYSWPLRMMLVTLISGLSSSLLMFILDWKVSIILILIGLLSIFFNSKQKDNVKKINDDIQKGMSKYTESLSTAISGFMTIKSLGLEGNIEEEAQGINKDIYENNILLSLKSAFLESRNFLFGSINFIGVIILASFLALKGLSGMGSVVSMIFLLGNVNRMFEQINGMIMQMQGFLAGSERIEELMQTNTEPDKLDMDFVKNSDAMIDLEDIIFSYDGINNVLNKVSLTVKKGQMAALAGPSGGGKSSIVKLILGYYQPSAGKMTIDGKAVRDITVEELRSLISYVPQDAYIFDGTVEENIRYGRYDASKEEIIAAAKAANVEEFIREFPDGYDTQVGERGIKLSGGQRQRIAIARALLKDAPILLLDEATSSLDSQNEQHVQEALNMLMKGKTVLIIAHRLSTIEQSDIIYIIDDGKVAEVGTHDDLLANKSLYHKLHTLQFKTN